MCLINQGKLLEGIRRDFTEEMAFQLAFAGHKTCPGKQSVYVGKEG